MHGSAFVSELRSREIDFPKILLIIISLGAIFLSRFSIIRFSANFLKIWDSALFSHLQNREWIERYIITIDAAERYNWGNIN